MVFDSYLVNFRASWFCEGVLKKHKQHCYVCMNINEFLDVGRTSFFVSMFIYLELQLGVPVPRLSM